MLLKKRLDGLSGFLPICRGLNIESAGCRGVAIGGAMVSEQHCNFLVNTGNANATDLENLGNLVQKKVQDATGIELEWEIKLLGIHKYSNLNSENVKL